MYVRAYVIARLDVIATNLRAFFFVFKLFDEFNYTHLRNYIRVRASTLYYERKI